MQKTILIQLDFSTLWYLSLNSKNYLVSFMRLIVFIFNLRNAHLFVDNICIVFKRSNKSNCGKYSVNTFIFTKKLLKQQFQTIVSAMMIISGLSQMCHCHLCSSPSRLREASYSTKRKLRKQCWATWLRGLRQCALQCALCGFYECAKRAKRAQGITNHGDTWGDFAKNARFF